jgi:CheY-like chemotaxis protein
MAKILLVEDDNNLREIYEARLMAEGYDIVSARDGEEALSVAIKEKPDLVISDVMMPKISGFDMLDILRTTEETKNVKVIMMTALSQAEDKARAEKLGADRYLVKSQVTLEDVAKVAKEVLEGTTAPQATPAPTQPVSPAPVADTPAVAPTPVVDTTPAVSTPTVPTEPVVADTTTSIPPQVAPTQPVSPAPVADTPAVAPTPVVDTTPAVSTPTVPTEPAVTEPTSTTDSDEPEEASHPAESTIDAEEQAIAQQLESIIAQSVPSASANSTPVQPSQEQVQQPSVNSTTAADSPQVPTEDATNKTARKVIEPINDLKQDMKPKLEALVAAEEQKEAMSHTAQETPQQTPAPVASTQETTLPQPATPQATDEKIDPNLIAL